MSIFENYKLKELFCRDGKYKYTGVSVSSEEFCHFKYQDLPGLQGNVDVTLGRSGWGEGEYVTVCLLKKSIEESETGRNVGTVGERGNETDTTLLP